MEANFPTIAVFKQSVRLPFRHMGDILVSIGIGIAAFAVAAITATMVALIAIFVFGIDTSGLAELPQRMTDGNYSGLGIIALITIVALFTALVFFAHIFNYWVTLAAYGADAAKWSFKEGRGNAAFVNAVKLLLISILIAIVNAVVIMFLSALGLAPGFAEQMAATDVSDSMLSGFAANLIGIVIGSAVYSLFSANLTQTAIMSTDEGLEHPHVVDFAIVLVLLYAVYFLPTVVAALSGSDALVYLVSLLLTLHLMFTIPIAHGLRYRYCWHENVTQASDDDNLADG